MTLCDAGPLIALIDKREAVNNERCIAVLPQLSSPLLTTWPCFTEAMYFLGSRGGLPLQKILWQYVNTGKLQICRDLDAEILRMQQLMETYHDLPMDLADATLVVAAEIYGLTQIFTLDTHFHAYRLQDKIPFQVLPL